MSSILPKKVETKDPRSLWTTQPNVDAPFHLVGIGRDTSRKDTTQASRPRTNGVGAPVQGLADRKDTTDS